MSYKLKQLFLFLTLTSSLFALEDSIYKLLNTPINCINENDLFRSIDILIKNSDLKRFNSSLLHVWQQITQLLSDYYQVNQPTDCASLNCIYNDIANRYNNWDKNKLNKIFLKILLEQKTVIAFNYDPEITEFKLSRLIDHINNKLAEIDQSFLKSTFFNSQFYKILQNINNKEFRTIYFVKNKNSQHSCFFEPDMECKKNKIKILKKYQRELNAN